MKPKQDEQRVKCHKCKKTFPIARAAKSDELENAPATFKKQGGVIRVARWCPWCQATNMVEVAIELVEERAVFRGVADDVLAGLAPKPGEEKVR